MRDRLAEAIRAKGNTFAVWYPWSIKMNGWCRDVYDGRWI